jgi:deoxyribodipyrimidine photolyase
VTPYAAQRDDAVRAALDSSTVEWVPEWGTLVHEPGHIRTNAGSLSQVFTPFFRVWERTPWTPWPTSGDALLTNDPGDALPKIDSEYPVLDGEVGEAALPGERGALARLDLAVARADTYDEDRNTPSLLGTSQLSIDLRFGTLSPRRGWRDIASAPASASHLLMQGRRRERRWPLRVEGRPSSSPYMLTARADFSQTMLQRQSSSSSVEPTSTRRLRGRPTLLFERSSSLPTRAPPAL